MRSRIEGLLVTYAHCIDDDELERWPEFFTEDGVYQIISRESFEAGHPIGIMLCRGRGMMTDRIRALRRANIYEPQRYVHLLGPPQIEAGEVSDTYRVRSNFQVVRTMENGATDLFATGKYLDRVTLAQDEPRLAERRVVLASRRIDTLLVVPL